MIVVSGGLVVVAIILLILGLVTGGLLAVYFSIGVSVVAFGFLLLGALQKRGEPTGVAATPGYVPAAESSAGVTLTREPAVDSAAAESEPAPPVVSGEVAVVPGRPRYHLATCRFLAGRADVETLSVGQAQETGYTACGVCRPDAALAAAAAAEPEPAYDDAYAESAYAEPAAEPAEPAKPAGRRTRAAGTATAEAPAETARPAKRAAATAAKAAPRAATTVVVIPDRDRFHTETCRFVRDVPGTMTVGKATAKRQGYTPCGVCKP